MKSSSMCLLLTIAPKHRYCRRSDTWAATSNHRIGGIDDAYRGAAKLDRLFIFDHVDHILNVGIEVHG